MTIGEKCCAWCAVRSMRCSSAKSSSIWWRADLRKWGGVAPLPELPLAIWCLSECRKLDRLGSAGRQLIRSVIALFRGSDDIETMNARFANDLQSAYRKLGSRWPGREELLSIALSVGTTFKTGLVTKHWSDFVAYVTGNREAVWALCRCENPYLPANAIAALAQRWPDETTRALLTQLAIDDQASELRAAALLALAGELPDETTRELLTRRAVKDQHHSPRSTALKSLAEKWPDETTRELLTRRAVADEHSSPRYVALKCLVEKWPDETTRELLTRRAVQEQDRYGSPRSIALESLLEEWPDETTRVFVTRRVILEPNDNERGSLLSKLAKEWPDESMHARCSPGFPFKMMGRIPDSSRSGHWRRGGLMERREPCSPSAQSRTATLSSKNSRWKG